MRRSDTPLPPVRWCQRFGSPGLRPCGWRPPAHFPGRRTPPEDRSPGRTGRPPGQPPPPASGRPGPLWWWSGLPAASSPAHKARSPAARRTLGRLPSPGSPRGPGRTRLPAPEKPCRPEHTMPNGKRHLPLYPQWPSGDWCDRAWGSRCRNKANWAGRPSLPPGRSRSAPPECCPSLYWPQRQCPCSHRCPPRNRPPGRTRQGSPSSHR